MKTEREKQNKQAARHKKNYAISQDVITTWFYIFYTITLLFPDFPLL